VGTTISYHAQDNYKLQRTGNFPALTCVLLLLLLLLLEEEEEEEEEEEGGGGGGGGGGGIHYEWNWANENAKHYNSNYCMHKIFQAVMNGFE